MKRLPLGKQRLIDEFQRELDAIEAKAPMTGSYERVTPYVIDQMQGGQHFEMLIFHRESQLWYDQKQLDWSFVHYERTRSIQPGDVVFDVGCNAGFTAAWYALAVGPTGKVHAFDPFPWNTLSTAYNARLNYLDNVEVHTVGIGQREEEIEISLRDAKISTISGDLMLPAKIRTLAQYADLKPSVVKLDVEGAEHDISLSQLERLKKVRLWMLEMHPEAISARGHDPRDTLRNFSKLGLPMRQNTPDGPAYALGEPVAATIFMSH